MPTLELAREDARVLAEVLKDYLSDLRMEISHTDSYEFREGLKARKMALRRVVEALEATQPEGGDVRERTPL